jgi:transposase-like protein
MKAKRKFTKEFKREVVETVRSGALTVTQALKQYEIVSSILYGWMDQYDHGRFGNEPTETGALENKIAELERKVGQQAMEIEFLKKVRAMQAQRKNGNPSGKPMSGSQYSGGAKC